MCRVRWFAISAKPSSECELVIVSRVKFCTLSSVPWEFQFCTRRTVAKALGRHNFRCCEQSFERQLVTVLQKAWLKAVSHIQVYSWGNISIGVWGFFSVVFCCGFFVCFVLFLLYRVWKSSQVLLRLCCPFWFWKPAAGLCCGDQSTETAQCFKFGCGWNVCFVPSHPLQSPAWLHTDEIPAYIISWISSLTWKSSQDQLRLVWAWARVGANPEHLAIAMACYNINPELNEWNRANRKCRVCLWPANWQREIPPRFCVCFFENGSGVRTNSS